MQIPHARNHPLQSFVLIVFKAAFTDSGSMEKEMAGIGTDTDFYFQSSTMSYGLITGKDIIRQPFNIHRIENLLKNEKIVL